MKAKGKSIDTNNEQGGKAKAGTVEMDTEVAKDITPSADVAKMEEKYLRKLQKNSKNL